MPTGRIPSYNDNFERVSKYTVPSASKHPVRVYQPVPLSPGEFEGGLDRINAFFDGRYEFRPMWPPGSGAGAGGLLTCVKRSGKVITTKLGLTVHFNFAQWAPDALELAPRGMHEPTLPGRVVASRQFGKHHLLRFRSQPCVSSWRARDICEVVSAIVAAFCWTPISCAGHVSIKEIKARGADIAKILGFRVRHRPLPRLRVSRISVTASPLVSLHGRRTKQREQTAAQPTASSIASTC